MKTQNETTLTVFYNDDYINPTDIETRTKAKPIAELIQQGEVQGRPVWRFWFRNRN